MGTWEGYFSANRRPGATHLQYPHLSHTLKTSGWPGGPGQHTCNVLTCLTHRELQGGPEAQSCPIFSYGHKALVLGA